MEEGNNYPMWREWGRTILHYLGITTTPDYPDVQDYHFLSSCLLAILDYPFVDSDPSLSSW
jgi:hypothetical protein